MHSAVNVFVQKIMNRNHQLFFNLMLNKKDIFLLFLQRKIKYVYVCIIVFTRKPKLTQLGLEARGFSNCMSRIF